MSAAFLRPLCAPSYRHGTPKTQQPGPTSTTPRHPSGDRTSTAENPEYAAPGAVTPGRMCTVAAAGGSNHTTSGVAAADDADMAYSAAGASWSVSAGAGMRPGWSGTRLTQTEAEGRRRRKVSEKSVQLSAAVLVAAAQQTHAA